MYHFEQQEQQVPEQDEVDESQQQKQPSYNKILQWSLNKLAASAAAASGRRRTSSATDLRRSLLIAGAMGKARAGILRERAMQFLEDRPQLMPPTGWYHCASRSQQQQQQLSSPSLPEAAEPESAFGYSIPMMLPTADEADDRDNDALSVSAEAIAMSSVELSIEEEPSPPSAMSMAETESQPQLLQTTVAVTSSRKRKQEQQQQPIRELPPPPPPPPQQHPTVLVHSPAKRTRQLAKSATTAIISVEPESLCNLQASFVDLSMSSSSASGVGCRQQASQFSSALLPCLPVGPECHAFA